MGKKEHEQEEKENMVNSAIKSLCIPEKLQLKIEGYLAYTQETLESQNELKAFFSVISPSLKELVVQHIFEASLSDNPVFNFDRLLVTKLTKRMEVQVNSPEDTVVEQGADAEHFFVISKGQFVVSVQDHESVSRTSNMLAEGDYFGEVALLLNCKRTATVRANNYATIAKVDKKSFVSLCREFEDLVPNLRRNMKTYNDRLKQFLVSIVSVIPYMSGLTEYALEDVAYHMKQRFYDKGEVVFSRGDPTHGNILIVSKGEVELLYKVDNCEFRMHVLGQGCHVGAYQLQPNYTYVFTARALCKTTVHVISRDSIEHLRRELPEFRAILDETADYVDRTEYPVVSFGMHRGPNTTVKDILRRSVGRIISMKRNMKQAKANAEVQIILAETNLNLSKHLKTNRTLENEQDFQNEIIKFIGELSTKINTNLDNFENRL